MQGHNRDPWKSAIWVKIKNKKKGRDGHDLDHFKKN